jgi:hypothetical protein
MIIGQAGITLAPGNQTERESVDRIFHTELTLIFVSMQIRGEVKHSHKLYALGAKRTAAER